MRIVAGEWAGQDLVSPGKRVRATAEAVRDRWCAFIQEYMHEARIVDLFAGSGALGLEALSRGAASADFIEDAPVALHALKANVASQRFKTLRPGQAPTARVKAARIFKKDVIPFVRSLDAGAYDIAFADPPYGSAKLDLVVQAWKETRFARILGVEHTSEHEVPGGGKRLDFGDVRVTIYGLTENRRKRRADGGKADDRSTMERR